MYSMMRACCFETRFFSRPSSLRSDGVTWVPMIMLLNSSYAAPWTSKTVFVFSVSRCEHAYLILRMQSACPTTFSR
jgi:hypothetical protein